VEQIKGAVARKRGYAATNKHETTEELLEAMFSMPSEPRLYSEDYREWSLIQVVATSEKAKPDTKNMRDMNWAAVKRMTVQVTRQPL
jgi:hypothetical protein